MNGRFYPGATVFKLYAEQGVPAEVTIMAVHDAGFTVEWPSFISEAIRNGWTFKRIYTAIVSAVRDAAIFTREQFAEFDAMCRRYFMSLEAAE